MLGNLVVARRAPGEEFSAADLRLLEDLARQAGAAVHAVRLTTELQLARQRLVTVVEDERRRLRRDLHDGLGPTLAGIGLEIEAARNLLSQDVRVADRALGGLSSKIEEAIKDIRRLVYQLRPPALDELGLAGALKGQKVHWHWGKLRYEDHTVTFPAKKARALAQRTGAPVCDPDGDGGPGPDNPPDTNQPPFCNNPNQLEFDIPARFAEKRGDGRFKRFDFSNSRAEGAGVHTGQDPYTLKFTRVAAKKGFGYICMIHPFMRARVVVKPRR